MQVSKRLVRGTDAPDALKFPVSLSPIPGVIWRARRPTRQMIGQATMDHPSPPPGPLGLLGLLKYAYILDRLPLEGAG